MRKLSISLSFVAIMAMGVSSVWANGTAAGVQIINTVTARYSNLGMVKYNTNYTARTNTVGRIFGIHGTSQNQTLTTTPGNYVAFQFNLTNKGNASTTLRLTNLYWNTNSGRMANGFTYGIYTNATKAGGVVQYFTLAEEQSRVFFLIATAPATALDQAALTNRFVGFLTNTYTGSFNYLASYQGMQGYVVTNYGGVFGITNRSIAIVMAPSLVILKSSFVTNSPSYLLLAANATARTQAVPGSEIIFSVAWTNAGSGNLQNFSFVDPLDPAYTWAVNSIYFTNGVRWNASHLNYARASNAAHNFADGAAARNTTGGNFGILANFVGNTVNVSFNSNIPGASRGTVFYKVYVK